jgi:membrane protease YdiL (CAAX protease family)
LFLDQFVATRQKHDEEKKAENAAALGDVVHYLPRNPRDYRAFIALSVTAGIVEEIVYRGYFIWYLAHVMPVWTAVIASSLVFGLSHAYQGMGAIMRTGLGGLVFGMLYVFSGSIWVAIIAHALFDILQSQTILELLRDE